MNYISLKKYKYINRGNVEAEYQRRFNAYDSIKIGVDISSSPAFFVETKEIREKASIIHKLDKSVLKLCNGLPAEAIANYMLSCLVEEIQNSNSIEGVKSTKKELLNAYSNKNDRFNGIVGKYNLLLSDGTISLNSCQDIRSLYDELVLQEVAEESLDNKPDGIMFRKGPVYVRNGNIEPVHEGILPEDSIIDSMTRALAFLNKEDEELLYRVAVFHYLIGYIHPFYDGNGRLNRFISSYMLTRELEPIIGYSLSNIIKENQSVYNKAFLECNDKENRGELTAFVDMFMDVLVESINNLIIALKSRSDLWKKYEKNIMKLPFSDEKHYKNIYKALVLNELFAPAGIEMALLKKRTRLSEPTLRKLLSRIDAIGLLKTDSSERRFKYGIHLDKLESYID